MRSLLVLIDGLGDDPIPAWQGRTPFEQAEHPFMDALAAAGARGSLSICENDIVPESCSCILRLLGVSRQDIPRNRAYLELLAYGRDISEYEMVLRCNLAAMDADGRLAAFNGQGLSAAAMRRAAAACGDVLRDVEFIHLSEYRNLLIMDRKAAVLEAAVPPPHESVGLPVDELLASLRRQSLSISCFLDESNRRLAGFGHDGLRYILYPWGASDRRELPSFVSLHGFQGGVVCKAEIVAGIARALGMETIVPPGATGDVDTDLAAKMEGALALLEHNRFVLAHFNGSDEAAHRYDYAAKADFIAAIDRRFLRSLAERWREPLKIVVCGDHVTSSLTGRHGDGLLPALAGCLHAEAGPLRLDSYRQILDFLMKESD